MAQPLRPLRLLDSTDRKRAFLLVFFNTILALSETLGAASLMPMVLVIFSPNVTEENDLIRWIFSVLNECTTVTEEHFGYLLVSISGLILLTTQAMKFLSTYFTINFGQKAEYNVSRKLLSNYMAKRYSEITCKHTTAYSKIILADVGAAIGGVVTPYLNLISSVILLTFLIVLLLAANPYLTLMGIGSVVLLYSTILISSKRKIRAIGNYRNQANDARFNIVGSIFNGIKDIKMTDSEGWFNGRYDSAAKDYAKYQAQYEFYEQMPRFLIETIAYVAIISFLLYSLNSKVDAVAISTATVFMYSIYRVLPCLQGIYASISKINYYNPVFQRVLSDLAVEMKSSKNFEGVEITLNKALVVSNVEFSHEGPTDKPLLNKINLEIPVSTMSIIYGPSGSGKTTLLDVIMGLFEPNRGKLLIDGSELKASQLVEWRKLIGYVPQNIYLHEGTIRENIAFACDRRGIRYDDVISAAKMASIHNFIMNFPEGYDTILGERGSNISGGQRQRIGIARALYRSPKILILDEATNGLDNITQDEIYNALTRLKEKMTIIVVTHQQNNLNLFDRRFKVVSGIVTAEL
jgi:ABC-type bacteriocin/lantibiotic exporter with double-glycine peptidase domain